METAIFTYSQESKNCEIGWKRSLLRNGILLHHDNARPHIAHCVLHVLQQSNAEILPHPPYSPDLTPCDFWLFPQFKKPLRGKHFSPDLNPVEHLWDLLERKVRQHNISSKDMLKSVLKNEWEKLSAKETTKLVKFNAEMT
ncbi:histone-lysine N-methyltransferase SETMAR [Trichonephila clavipes]|nr:histone-lysine N-methyltransferase SETMAR [Trichonephila clavipes]